MKEELYCNKMVVLALPSRDVEEELYCNKMVVLVLPCRDVEGGALLQQDDAAVLPQHGQGGVTRGFVADCQGENQQLAKERHRLRDARQRAAAGK